MPPFSTDDYHKLLQKIAVLETKIHRLEVNVEVNGQYGNETTLPMTQNSGQELANRQLISSTTKKETCVNGSKSTSSPPWNLLGAKPKHNSGKDTSDMRRRLTGRTQHREISDETGWPALPSHRSVSSTPVPRRKQPWMVATKRSKSKPHQDTEIRLENRFAPLVQDHDCPKESSSPDTGKRYETKSVSKRLQRELTTGSQTLIVGDGAVKDLKLFCSMKNTKVLCFPNDMVSDISKKILKITDEHLTVRSLIIHTGALDVVKQQSEVLKQDFIDLLNKVQSLNMDVYLSGPLPTVRRGDERFSRLMMLNRWLKDICAALSVNYIDNFYIFWERRHLFKSDGFDLNKSGVRVFSSNIFYFVRQTPAAPAKDKRQDNPKQPISRRCGEELLVPEIRTDHGGQLTQKEASAPKSAPSPQQDESPPAQEFQQEKSALAPTGDSQSSPPQSPPSPPLSSLSPDSPLLDFTDRMKDLVNIGIQFTPRQTPFFSPINPPHRPAPPVPPRPKQPSTKSRRAPPPPMNLHDCESD